MAVFRSYWQSQATLIHENPSNNSRNPIIELSYGGGSVADDTKASRYIFKVDFTTLRDTVSAGELVAANVNTHQIHLRNVIAFAQEYIGGQMYDAKRGSGVIAYLLPLTESFDEGTGYDYLVAQSSTSGLIPAVNAPNWTHRRTNQPWTTAGAIALNNLNLPADAIASCALPFGNEDLVFDVTAYVNNTLFNSVTDYGFMVCFAAAIENIVSPQRQVITFYSKYTDSFFRPYLETTFSHEIHERRCDFYLDEPNDLFLSATKPLDSVDRVEIYDHNDDLIQIIPQNNIVIVRPGLYKITLDYPADDYPDSVMFHDTWYYHLNSRSRKQEQDFTLNTRDLFSVNHIQDSEFWCSYSGIKHNEVIPQVSPKRRIVINPKQFYEGVTNTNPQVDNFQYRIYTQQGKAQVEIIPYTNAYKINDTHFFELDFSWLIPTFYFLELQVVGNNALSTVGQTIKFRVVA